MEVLEFLFYLGVVGVFFGALIAAVLAIGYFPQYVISLALVGCVVWGVVALAT